jgi:hypothetical protein
VASAEVHAGNEAQRRCRHARGWGGHHLLLYLDVLAEHVGRHGERGRREGMKGIRILGLFWYINFKKHIEGVSSDVFLRVVKL